MINRETSLQEEIYLDGTNLLPSVTFLREGSMRIEGRIIPDNVIPFFNPLIDWVKNLKSSKVIFDIDIEYMNSNASAQLFQLLKTLNENQSVSSIIVFWHYEEEDQVYLETGKLMAEQLKRIRFFFKSYVK